MFTFEKRNDDIDDSNSIDASGFENGSSGVIVDGNKVYYNHHFHGSSHFKFNNRISNGNNIERNGSDIKYGHEKSRDFNATTAAATSTITEKENKCEIISMQRSDDDQNYSSYGKYSRRDGSNSGGTWKNHHRHEHNKNSDAHINDVSSKLTKPYSITDYPFNSDSNLNKKHFDDTMFPFDRATVAYDPRDNNIEWKTNKTNKRQSHGSNNYYDSSSPEYDAYEHNQYRKSDERHFKESTLSMRKQKLPTSKLSKYEYELSSSSMKNENHSKNHISDLDAFSLSSINKSNSKINSAATSNDNTTITATITTTAFNSNANTVSIVNTITNQTSNAQTNVCHSAKEHNSVSQFEQIASKFDKIPPKSQQSDAFRMYNPDIKESTSILSLKMHSNPCKLTLSQQQINQVNEQNQYGVTTSPVPDLRVDFFSESMNQNAQKRHSFVEITLKQIVPPLSDASPSKTFSTITSNNTINSNASGINVTSNPMDDTTSVTCTTQTPRATIVVQQVKNIILARE